MKQWDYLVFSRAYDVADSILEENLNREGHQGWELVSVTFQTHWIQFIMKRLKPDDPK